MKPFLRIPVRIGLCLAGALVVVVPALLRAAETPRTVYVSAVDAKGEFVTDLTVADLAVKEGGQVRQVTSLTPATEPKHVALIVDDSGEGWMRAPVVEFLNTAANVVVSIRMLSPQAIVLNDYSTDPSVVQQSILKLIERGRPPADLSLVSDAVSAAARDMQKRKLSRPVIVVLTSGGEAVEQQVARTILNDLRDSGASLHVVRLVNLEVGTVLNDGSQQSGGSNQVGGGPKEFSDATKVIARRLSHQYKLTYVLPDGVKPNERLEVTTSRPGVKVAAPTRIATK